jgi:spore germination protein KA
MGLPKKVQRFTGFRDPWKIHKELDRNVQVFKKMFYRTTDVVFRNFVINWNGENRKGIIIYIDGLVNSEAINRDILERIVMIDRKHNQKLKDTESFSGVKWMSLLIEQVLSANNLNTCMTITDLKDGILSAQAIILIDGIEAGIVAGVEGFETRGINEPESSVVIRGPREGFTENLRTNTSLIRRKIKSHHLKTESMIIGRKTQTKICLMYLDNVINHKILEEIKIRLNRIDIDAILESCYIEELIEDNPYSPFPSINTTERSDDAAAAILEGRIIIVVDNTPFVLNAPMVFEDILHSSEDYYNRYIGGTIIRVLRFVALFISLFLPSLYIAVVTFHPEMLPTTLLISVAAAREGVPFPAIVEAILMEITFEVLKEAGARMPKAIGSTVSIVGGLILGEAAVSAGLVSQPMVIIVAGTAIASFSIPGYGIHSSLRFLRFPFMFLAGFVGLYGIVLGFMVLLFHLCSLRSFGVPYMAPFAPLIKEGLKDSLIRAPWWSLKYRPQIITWRRQRRNRTPKPSPLLLIILCFASSFLLTGCWDMEEINYRAIVAGVGLDLVQDENNENKYIMTVQVVKPNMVAEKSGGGDSGDAVWVLSAEGKTVHDAARNMVRYSGRNLFWSHSLVIVIGEDLARNGVEPILDFFDRTAENRLRTWFLIAKNQQAKQIMNSKSNLETLSSVELASMLKVRERTSFAAAIYLRDFLYFIYQSSRSPVASAVETYTDNQDNEALFITGSAAFKNDKLVDFYDEIATRGILWVVGDVKGGIITIDWEDYKDVISTEIINTKNKINIKITNNKELEVNVIVENECKVSEIEQQLDLTGDSAVKKIEQAVSDEIKKEILSAIKKAQEQQLDVFGIGEEVKRQHPNYWKGNEQNWDQIFSQLEFTLNVDTKIKRFGTSEQFGVKINQ